ncbi:MAG: energy-coupling factor ABC transporter ATP-binding protein [Clostridiales Family XIII bacterium]|nr:energy-coupling factor ABC transporter ATP-binding protein [Clostridiales Family XIII bacterium]
MNSTESTKIIKINRLTFSYDESTRPSLTDINLEIDVGSITVLIGPSGCGKTTLCRCMMGVIPKLMKGTLAGDVYLADTEIAQNDDLKISTLSQIIGFVMQETDAQIVMSTVEDDLAFGPENLMVEPEEIRVRVNEILMQMSLDDHATRNPAHLSGGEKQRLAIGGVLAMQPDILVFDEPVSNLDAAGKSAFVEQVKILKALGKTIVIVEHDFDRLDFADRWVLMKDGAIVCDASPADIPKQLLEYELWI